jgi:hypothetical protein
MRQTNTFRSHVKHLVAIAAGAALVSSLSLIGLSGGAGAAVQRYQFESMSITVALFGPSATSTNVHQYTVTLNPCDGTFAGLGGGFFGVGGAEYVTESVTGTYVGGNFSLSSTYDGSTYGSPYTYAVGPVAVALSAETPSLAYTFSSGTPAGTYPVWITLSANAVSSYTNHGQYVSSTGGGDDAANSCIGMPIQSQS